MTASCPEAIPFSLPPCTPFSSRDSGYGSESTTPEKQAAPGTPTLQISALAFNGNGGESIEFSSPDTDEDVKSSIFSQDTLLEFQTPKRKTAVSRTAPSHKKAKSTASTQTLRCTLPVSFYSTPTRVQSRYSYSESLPGSPSGSSRSSHLRSVDRFVHPRNPGNRIFGLGDRFRLTQAPDELSPVERILRHSGATRDAFYPSPPRFNPMPTGGDLRLASLHEARFPPVARTGTVLEPVDTAVNTGVPLPVTPHMTRGSVWSAMTTPPVAGAMDDGSGRLVQTGTNAPYYLSKFVFSTREKEENENKHMGRLTAAMDIDPAARVLTCNADDDVFTQRSGNITRHWKKKTQWTGAGWVKEGDTSGVTQKSKDEPLKRPLRILSAPNLRDDFYCSLLAYSPTCDTIAIGLGDLLYRWSETEGARLLNGHHHSKTYLTALAFSSAEGGRNILAFGRLDGTVGLTSMREPDITRIRIQERLPISCISWRPTETIRPSKNPDDPDVLVGTEDLLIGDEGGSVLYYIVEWPDESYSWRGNITVVSRITVHQQPICGLSWTPDGMSFASGGNDNMCCFFHANDVLPWLQRQGNTGWRTEGQVQGTSRKVLPKADIRGTTGTMGTRSASRGVQHLLEWFDDNTYVRRIKAGMENRRWNHGAAVKAIAFCPWQKGLVATGGGSNDKCVHFFHTKSGAALATIFVSAQVTSLIWSTTRREIAVTFGFTHPGHAIRIAIFAWPSCKQVAAIPWEGNHRALYGISCAQRSYLRPTKSTCNSKDASNKGQEQSRTMKEGCIAIASSDESIKFYELWPSDAKPVTSGVGMLGGSDILEDLEGIHKDGDVIR